MSGSVGSRQRVASPAEEGHAQGQEAAGPAAVAPQERAHAHAPAHDVVPTGARARGRARAGGGGGVLRAVVRRLSPNQQAVAALVMGLAIVVLGLVVLFGYLAVVRTPRGAVVLPSAEGPAPLVPTAASAAAKGATEVAPLDDIVAAGVNTHGDTNDDVEMDSDARGAVMAAHAATALWSVDADVLAATGAAHDALVQAARDTQRYVSEPPPGVTDAVSSAAVDEACVQATGGDLRALPCQRLHLVIAQYRESLSWLHGPGNDTTAAPVPVPVPVTGDDAAWLWTHVPTRTVYDQHNALSPYFLAPNVGHEAHAYLQFLVTHYHQLPRVVVFVQAHPFDHQPDLLKYVRALRDSTPHDPLPYTPLGVLRPEAASSATAPASYVTSEHMDLARYESEYTRWTRDFPGANVPPLPPADADALRVGCYDRALFAVSREVIRRNPLKLYQSLLSALVAHTNDWSDARSYGALMEYGWHALFGAPWVLPRWHATAKSRAAYCARSFRPDACRELFGE